ncbi:MAG: hypothetical protein AB7F76_14395 [Parvibaculaceae bacterium]
MFKSAFEPAMVENLAAALEDACVRYARIAGECDSTARDEIANRMIGAARHGEQDPETLVQSALRGMTAL